MLTDIFWDNQHIECCCRVFTVIPEQTPIAPIANLSLMGFSQGPAPLPVAALRFLSDRSFISLPLLFSHWHTTAQLVPWRDTNSFEMEMAIAPEEGRMTAPPTETEQGLPGGTASFPNMYTHPS